MRNEGRIWKGLLLCGGINYVLAVTGGTVAWSEAQRSGGSDALVNAAFGVTFSIGLLQLLYVIPICRALKKNRRARTLKGVTIAAWTMPLLNAAWFVLKAAQHVR